jgi:hypothetical protein
MTPGYDVEGVKCIAESTNGKSLLMACTYTCPEFQMDDSHPDENKCWVPKSQITENSEVDAKGDYGTLSVTEWLAIKKGWL